MSLHGIVCMGASRPRSPPVLTPSLPLLTCCPYREVHRARSRKTNTVVAMKKIIMHHEKDGVRCSAIPSMTYTAKQC